MGNPVFVALDTPNLDRAIEIAKSVKGHVGGLKLGLEFFCAHGHHGVHEIQKIGLPIFLDLKLEDLEDMQDEQRKADRLNENLTKFLKGLCELENI